MFCPKCGRKIRSNTRRCPNCGYRIRNTRVKRRTKNKCVIAVMVVIIAMIAILFTYYKVVNPFLNDLQQLKNSISSDNAQKQDLKKEENQSDSKNKEQTNEITPLQIHFIDVGQGDGALLQCGGQTAMIDTGSLTAGKENVVSYLQQQEVTAIDYLFLSHGHEDHMGAVYDIIWKSDIEIKNAIYDFGNSDDGNVTMLNNSMLEKKIPNIKPVKNDVYKLGDAEIQIILDRDEIEKLQKELPEDGDETLRSQTITTNVNNQSIAMLVKHGDNSFLFYGDGEKEYEDFLLEKCPEVKNVTVLKAPHHGGGNSCQDITLKQLSPKYTVVSSESPDAYGFPAEDVIERLEDNNSENYYTYKNGTILAVSDGKNVEFTKEKE